MEIRLVEKDKKGRIRNVEIYTEQDFMQLLNYWMHIELQTISIWDLLTNNLYKHRSRFLANVHTEFADRLVQNKNKTKR